MSIVIELEGRRYKLVSEGPRGRHCEGCALEGTDLCDRDETYACVVNDTYVWKPVDDAPRTERAPSR